MVTLEMRKLFSRKLAFKRKRVIASGEIMMRQESWFGELTEEQEGCWCSWVEKVTDATRLRNNKWILTQVSSKDDGGLNISFSLGRDSCLWLGKKKKSEAQRG